MLEERNKINRFMGIVMSITMGTVLGTVGVVVSGHFTIFSWLVSIIVSDLLGILLTITVPIKKLSDLVTEQFVNEFWKTVVSSLILNLLYAPVLTSIMLFSMSYFANDNIDKEIAIKQEQLVKAEDSLTSLESSGLDNGRIENYEVQVEELKQEIKALDEGRPHPERTVLKSILLCYGVSTIVCIIVQPLWLKIAFRKYLNLR